MDNYFSLIQKGKEAYLKKLDEVGWFESVFTNKQVTTERLSSIEDPLLFVFALSLFSFDPEGFCNVCDYKNLTSEFLQFIPDASFSINEDENKITIQIKDHTYSYSLVKSDDDWLEEEFFDFINTILKEEKLNYQFYGLPPDDQIVSLIAIEPEKYTLAIQEGIIPEDDGYFFKLEYDNYE